MPRPAVQPRNRACAARRRCAASAHAACAWAQAGAGPQRCQRYAPHLARVPLAALAAAAAARGALDAAGHLQLAHAALVHLVQPHLHPAGCKQEAGQGAGKGWVPELVRRPGGRQARREGSGRGAQHCVSRGRTAPAQRQPDTPPSPQNAAAATQMLPPRHHRHRGSGSGAAVAALPPSRLAHLCTTSSLRRSRGAPRREPPPMPKRSKMSAGPPPPPPPIPSFTASSPNCSGVTGRQLRSGQRTHHQVRPRGEGETS